MDKHSYRQQGGTYSIPGPTIRVVPGNKYVLRFHNTLPYQPLSPDENVFKDPNASNIHTHGLHISPMSPGDDVMRAFEGGRGGDFVWDIPANHMGGTHWYHAHHHGATYLQVSAGLFGLLIVDDENDGLIPNVSSMTERQLVFGYLNPAVAGTGGDNIVGGNLTAGWTVNGLVNGNICMPPNTWQHFRVLVADANANMKTVEFGPNTEVKLLARDGVWRTLIPGSLTNNKIELTGASRADFAVRVTGTSWIKIDNTTVANISTSGTPNPLPHPYAADGVSTWSAIRPPYLRDLRTENNVHNQDVSMGARTINAVKFNHMVPTFTLPAGQVQNFNLSGANMHPFHMHVYHVQAQQSANGFEAGEYYDVVAASMNLRFDLNNTTSSVFNGMTILHCHILDHEDRGAMGWYETTGGAGPPTFPADNYETFSVYYTLPGPCTTIVSNAANDGLNSLRSLLDCIPEDGTITYLAPGTLLTSPLTINKNVTIKGPASGPRPVITIPSDGVIIANGKTLTLQNVDINSTNPAQTFSGTGTINITGLTIVRK